MVRLVPGLVGRKHACEWVIPAIETKLKVFSRLRKDFFSRNRTQFFCQYCRNVREKGTRKPSFRARFLVEGYD